MALRLRRGTDAERLTITPLQGELIYTTDTAKIYVGDGATQGGVLIGPYDLENDTTPQLAGDLDLNGNNITGTGNINITGTVTATGDINLGDADADSITVAGLINSNLRPATDQAYDLGSASRYWRNVFATGLEVNGQASVGSLAINGNIEANDSTIIYDSNSNSLAVSSITAEAIDGNLTGSVFSDDSATVLVDATNNTVFATITETPTIYGSPPDRTDGLSIFIPSGSSLNIISHNGEPDNFTTTSPGDSIAGLTLKGATDNLNSKVAVGIFSSWDATADLNTVYPRGNLSFAVGQNSANPGIVATLDYTGNFSASSITPGTYADATARDAAITSPVAGQMVFLTDGDGAGNPKFQGNTDGTTGGWVDLN